MPEVDRPPPVRPEPRQWSALMSIGPPRRPDPDVAQRWEHATQTPGRPGGSTVVLRERRTDPSAKPGPAPAAADRDAAVSRRSQVMQRESAVRDALTTGPTDLGETLGDRLGQDHVPGPCHEPPAEPRPRCRPRIERHHRRVRVTSPSPPPTSCAPAVRTTTGSPGLAEHPAPTPPSQPGPLAVDSTSLALGDDDPTVQEDAPQAACQGAGWMSPRRA